MSESSNQCCPYCNAFLEKIPKRKTKCPFCTKEIYVRSKQSIFFSKLLKYEDALAVDSLIKLENYGINESKFHKKKKELSSKFGNEAKSGDIIWGIYNELILNIKDRHSLKMIYYEMGILMNKEGKDGFALLQQSAKMDLLCFKEEGFIKKVRIMIAGEDSCEDCKKWDNKVFTLQEALELMPIPERQCSHKLYDEKQGFCRCCYLGEDDY